VESLDLIYLKRMQPNTPKDTLRGLWLPPDLVPILLLTASFIELLRRGAVAAMDEVTASTFGAERMQRPAHRFHKRLLGAGRDLTQGVLDLREGFLYGVSMRRPILSRPTWWLRATRPYPNAP
jgi:hypothetical protein